jgi:hypothetical protein
MTIRLDRRAFLGVAGAATALPVVTSPTAASAADPLAVPDEGWSLWIDREAAYADDLIHLPGRFELSKLPVNPPTGGWAALDAGERLAVTLPATVEEHMWGKFGLRPYTGDEYRYAEDDAIPQNGAYRGVSWWSRAIDIPASAKGKRVVLHIRGARLRAEVFLNRKLVGYSIMEELPFECDLTEAMAPGGANRLDIRITNPGGRYDWRDSTTMMWGKLKLFASHGFGGLDRGMSLTVHPMSARIRDAYVLNTPDPRKAVGVMEIEAEEALTQAALDRLAGRASVTVVADDVIISTGESHSPPPPRPRKVERISGGARLTFDISEPGAKLWDLKTCNLYRAQFRLGVSDTETDTRDVRFGFRWFSPEGIGTNALLRLNGKRIKLYSSISWGYWGYNGLWPTKELARREVTSAQALGLNCLHFHRNVGKAEVFEAMDEMGLLRVMEPGGGRHGIGRDLKPGESLNEADTFSRDFMVMKCAAMARAFRSHPSLVQYTIQNEIGANLENPDVRAIMDAVHEADPSRTVILNDGFVQRGAAQAMYLPWSDHYYRSDKEQWGGWWDNHQGAGDQWYDKFYKDKDSYIHQQTGKPFIVEFGEMEGCAVADNHVKIVADILAHGGKSYDLDDHKVIVENTSAFLDKWGFRKAFPTTESLFLSIGRKVYESFQNYMENIRIGDEVDVACISGWETTAIENHSGIVDNLRYFKADPKLLRVSLLPVRPVAKQRKLAYALGESAELDIYLFNDTNAPVTGKLTLSVVEPGGVVRQVATYDAPAHLPDQFRYLLAEKVVPPPLTREGMHQIRLELSGRPDVTFVRDIWVTDTRARLPRRLRIGLSGVAKSLRDRLTAVDGATFEDFRAGVKYDGIIASGLKAEEIQRRQIGEQTGLEAQPSAATKPALVLGELPPEVLAAVKAGTPLIAMVPEDGLADGIAKQLSAMGLFEYKGQVGNLRAPWMGNWNYLRAHPLHAGIPSDMAMSVLHQVEGQPSNGLIVDGEGVEVIVAYSRDHDRHNGAASFIAQKDGMRVLFHRLPDMAGPLQTRWLVNAMSWLG